MGIRILGTGSFVPERVVENEEFTKFVDTSDEWIVKHSGIKRRRLHDGANFEMAAAAAERALESAGLSPLDLDLILCTTVSSDYATPSLACVVQGKIGAKNALAMDLNAACAGFVFGLDAARLYLRDGMRRVMVISSEKLSQITNYADRSTCVLFGDGAGAVVLEDSDAPFAGLSGPTAPGPAPSSPATRKTTSPSSRPAPLPPATASPRRSPAPSIWTGRRSTNSP